MFVSRIIDAFGGKSSSCWTPDDPFIQKKRPILTPFQRENRKIQGVGQKRKVQQTLEFTGLLWRRVRDSNPRFLLGTRHFECRTFDLSDNSPYISSVILAPEECKKNTQERYEIVKSEPAQSPVRWTFSADETAGASKNFTLITLQLIQHQLVLLYHTLTPFATLFPDRLAVLHSRPQKNGNTPRFFCRNVL